MQYIDPIHTKSWKNLKNHFQDIKNVHLRDLFNQDVERFKKFSIVFDNVMLIDFSKNRMTDKTFRKLISLAYELKLEDEKKLMFEGHKINYTENRSVLHIALRNIKNKPIYVNGKNIMPQVHFVLNKMKLFSKLVINGDKKGYTGKSITDIVNIGIGGSNLGPYMATEALIPYKNHLKMHYVSNLDGTHISSVLKIVNPETTLFIITSKTFTTEETMINAYSARNWFLEQSGNIKYISDHFLAISMNWIEVEKFGIHDNHFFEFWDWVGGRYSLWSSVGLSIILSIGFDNFVDLLSGAQSMDEHFLNTDLEKNIPVILALIGIWYNNFFGFETEGMFVYDQNMHKFANYLQQCNMESNGKSINKNGKLVKWQTGPIIWGEAGTNGQHAFYQLLHQGTKIIPSDFIIPLQTHNQLGDHHIRLLSNFFAQTKALAFGQSVDDNKKKIILDKNDPELIEKIIPFKLFEGNRPTNSILIKKLTPYTLGSLLALYEHKIFTQGVIFNIFSFDQWGVELGKELASEILSTLKKENIDLCYDSSTNNLIRTYNDWKN
ncbi:Glucose-6-phosphate isomerase [Buchnera aphidicola (Eriosoma grossulariae)]|uniref:glucose-6-phosphate isomerase n=1 Tax=Buchnera aphidicola TaxID=9 RepID=UPI003464C80B